VWLKNLNMISLSLFNLTDTKIYHEWKTWCKQSNNNNSNNNKYSVN